MLVYHLRSQTFSAITALVASTHTHRHTNWTFKHTLLSHSSMYPLSFTLHLSRKPQMPCVQASVSVVGSSLIILISNKDHYSSHGGVAPPTCMRQQYICQYQPLAVRFYIYLSLLFPLWDCILLFATGGHFSCFAWALQRHNGCLVWGIPPAHLLLMIKAHWRADMLSVAP